MSEQPKSSRGSSEHRGSGNIWFVLIVIAGAVLVSAFLVSDTQKRLPYPHLIELLSQTATLSEVAADAESSQSAVEIDEVGTDPGETVILRDDASNAADPTFLDSPSRSSNTAKTETAKIVVPGSEGKSYEYSNPTDILVADDSITGQIKYRVLTGRESDARVTPTQVEFLTIRGYPNDALGAELITMLDRSGVNWDYDRPSRFFENHWPELLMIGVLVALGIVMLRRMGGVGSPMSFSRSRGKLYSEEDLPTTFEDAAGIDEAVDEVREVVDFLRNSEKYQSLGGRIPKGVLLVGPPGTGKTLLARAIAGEAGVPFFSLSGSDFVEMFVGVGAARVRDMFTQATNRAPCIIFIDELDALGKSRSGNAVGGHDEREQTLNALLVEMDGFGANSGVIVIAATNRPETLDPALLRPGRFDRHVLVDRPDVAGREHILSVHVKNVKLDEDVDLRRIASITSGFVGADLSNLVNEAALLAARNERPSVGMDEFNDAVERVTAGLEKKNRVMNEDEKIRVAYHESAHALVAAALPNTDPVHKVSIIPRGLAALGYMMQRPESERFLMTKSELESQMKVMLAGTLAEEMVFQDISTGAQNDLERCTEVARSMVMDYGMSRIGRVNLRRSTRSPFLSGGGMGDYQVVHSEEMAKLIDKEVSRIVEDMLLQTRDILQQRREVLEAVTQRLLEVEAIDSTELMRLIREHSKGPWLVPGTVNAKPKAKIVPRENDDAGQSQSSILET
ncbi:ATP-dependent zinc metalloprotease FtsH 4 [Allorhodopirellula heiligendammensis]|uniref:ATP-dependent zinc metalloprotease FtsH n=1 Tax=Allorhodopirellula heiligendammensis TaxID=2714739 RepID=A0A5C6C4W4_9BACT|nr:ATP-dependent zinc metalloprotease FtsH [Allorhodopirellula heiligendammensis]TWU18374.1 ATP-dependent zinc metalloprotease FtsH 4 [Allorhodopirellula heiligendammensis]